MNRWTDRLTFAALLFAALFLTPATFAQMRGDGQPRIGQAQPRSGQPEDDKKRADQEKSRADQEKKRREDDRRRAEDQRRRNLPRPDRVVFVAGYFYDPYYGPLPWWPRSVYPARFSIGDRTSVRVQVSPNDAAVYVDGYYAGVVDDFDGVFQALPLLPGEHRVAFYLPGYETVTRNIYLPPGSTFRLKEVLVPLAPGAISEPPILSPLVPEPPAGTFAAPRTPPRNQPAAPAVRSEVTALGFGTLALRVQPTNAVVTIDGHEWLCASDLTIVLAVGEHTLTVSVSGRAIFSSTVVIRENETTELNVSLPPAPRTTD
jgi:PEGA domain